MSEIYVT